MRWIAVGVVALVMAWGLTSQARVVAAAQPAEKPFGLPFDTEPGPSTWLLGQLYGNTIGAYRTRVVWYGAGQGLHFGLDFPARCGTPVVAIGDGVVIGVDDLSHGAGPHNLIIRHNDAYLSLYGHLLETPSLPLRQTVSRGQVIGQFLDFRFCSIAEDRVERVRLEVAQLPILECPLQELHRIETSRFKIRLALLTSRHLAKIGQAFAALQRCRLVKAAVDGCGAA